MHADIFVVIVTFILGGFGLIWSQSNWPNIFVKFALLFMGMWGVLITLQNAGVILIK